MDQQAVTGLKDIITTLWGVGGGIGAFLAVLVVLRVAGYRLASRDTPSAPAPEKKKDDSGTHPRPQIISNCPIQPSMDKVEVKMDELVKCMQALREEQIRGNTWLELLCNTAISDAKREHEERSQQKMKERMVGNG